VGQISANEHKMTPIRLNFTQINGGIIDIEGSLVPIQGPNLIAQRNTGELPSRLMILSQGFYSE